MSTEEVSLPKRTTWVVSILARVYCLRLTTKWIECCRHPTERQHGADAEIRLQLYAVSIASNHCLHDNVPALGICTRSHRYSSKESKWWPWLFRSSASELVESTMSSLKVWSRSMIEYQYVWWTALLRLLHSLHWILPSDGRWSGAIFQGENVDDYSEPYRGCFSQKNYKECA